MKRILFLSSILIASFIAKAQNYTPIAGNWQYFNLKVVNGFAPPTDTLSTAPAGSIATKGTTLYVKSGGGTWFAVSGSGGSGAIWGVNITGTITSQSDLMNLFGAKRDSSRRNVDTLYAITDSTFGYYVNGTFRTFKALGAVQRFNGRIGAIVLTQADVNTALGYIPLAPADSIGRWVGSITSNATGDSIVYYKGVSRVAFKYGGGGGGGGTGSSDSLKHLFVDTSANPRNGYVLAFDSTNRKWKLVALSAGGAFDTATSQGGGIHTQPYNDVRYLKRGDSTTSYSSIKRLSDSIAAVRNSLTGVDTFIFRTTGLGVAPYTYNSPNKINFPSIRDTSASATQYAADSALTIATHDTTSSNALQPKYRTDTSRTALYFQIGQRVLNGANANKIIANPYSTRPTASSCPGCFFGSTDSLFWDYSNGTLWIRFLGSGGGGGGGGLTSFSTNGTSGPAQYASGSLNIPDYSKAVTSLKSIAALYSFPTTGLNDSSVVIVTDTIAGGAFVYKSTSTTAEDSGTVFKPTGGSGRWFRVYNGWKNISFWGIYSSASVNWTQRMQLAWNSSVGSLLYHPKGSYIVDSLIYPANLCILGESRRSTRLVASTAGASSFIRLGPGQSNEIFWADVSLLANAANAGQNAFDFTAVPGATTGGLWNFDMYHVDVTNFRGTGINLTCFDGAFDMAHQFLTFRQIRIYCTSDTSSHGIVWKGQVNQTSFNDIEVDGPTPSVLGTLGIYLVSSTSSNDQIVGGNSFNNLSVQGFDVALKTFNAQGTSFNNCYFESDSVLCWATNSSTMVFRDLHLSNVGNTRYVFGNDNSNLWISVARMTPNPIAGRFVGSPSGTAGPTHLEGISGQTNNTVSTTFIGQNVNVAANTLNTGYFTDIVTNVTTAKNLYCNTINSSLVPGNTITIRAYDPSSTNGFVQFRSTGGNIGLPANLDSNGLILRSNQTATFMRSDLISIWALVSVSQPDIYMNAYPTTGSWFTGEKVYNNNPTPGTAAYWFSKQGGIPGSMLWDSVVGGRSGTDTSTTVSGGLNVSRAGNVVNIAADSLARKLLPNERILYNANSWVSGDIGTTFAYTGTGGEATVVGGKIQMTGGTQTIGAATNSLYNKVLKLASYGGTLLPRVKIVTKYKVSGTLSSSTSGLAAGQYSTNVLASLSSMMGYFNTTTTGTGTASLLLGTSNTNVATSPTSVAYTSGDYLISTIERDYDKVYISVRDATTDSAMAQTVYQYDATNATNSITPNVPNTGVFGWANLGGTVTIDSISITTTIPYGPTSMALTDSKGWYTTPTDVSIGGLLQRRYPGIVISGGPTDGIRDVQTRLKEITQVIHPQQTIMVSIPRNEYAFGVADAVWRPICVTVDSTIKAAGIVSIWTDGVFENQSAQASVYTFIDSAFAPNVIRTLKVGNIAANVSSDNIHPSVTGASNFVRTVTSSGKLKDLGQYINSTYSPDSRWSPYYDSLRVFGALHMDFGTYHPATQGIHDIFVAEGGSFRAAYGSSAQQNAFTVAASSNAAMQWYNYTGGLVSTTPSFQWFTAPSVTGSVTEAMRMWEDGVLSLGTTLRLVHPAASSYVLGFGKGLWSGTAGGANDSTDGGIIPMQGSGFQEYQIYGRGGGFNWKIASASAGNSLRFGMRLFASNNMVIRDSVDKGSTLWVNGALAVNKDSVTHSATAAGTQELLVQDTTTGKFGRIPVSSISGSTNPLVFAMTADGTVTNSAGNQSIVGTGTGSSTIAANTLTVGRRVVVKGLAYISTDVSAPTLTISFANSSSNASASVSSLLTSSMGSAPMEYEFYGTIRSTGSSGTIELGGWVSINGTKGYLPNGALTFNTTVSQTFDVFASFGTASTNNTIVSKQHFLTVN